MHETTSTHEPVHEHKKPRNQNHTRAHGMHFHAHPEPPHSARRSEEPQNSESRGLSALQQALAKEISNLSPLPHEDFHREAPAEPEAEQVPRYSQGVQGVEDVSSGEEELSEESTRLLEIEAEAPLPASIDVSEEIPEDVIPETVEAEVEVPVVTPSFDTETPPISSEKTAYQPKAGDLADLGGERVRLERPLEAEGTQVGFEIIKHDGTTDFVPNGELEFVDPVVEKRQIEADLTREWAKQKQAIEQNFKPSVIGALWNEPYNDTINRGIGAFTDRETAERKRGSNRISLIAGQAALAIAVTHIIQSRGQFVLDNDAVTSEKVTT